MSLPFKGRKGMCVHIILGKSITQSSTIKRHFQLRGQLKSKKIVHLEGLRSRQVQPLPLDY